MPRRETAVTVKAEDMVAGTGGLATPGHRFFAPSVESFSIAPGVRTRLVLLLTLYDLFATGVALRVSLDTDMKHDLLTFAFIIVFAARLGGLYAVKSSGEIQRSVRCVLAFGAVLLLADTAAAWVVAGEPAALRAAAGTICGVAIAGLGRVGCAFVVRYFADQTIERVLLIGECQPAEWLNRSAYVLNRKVRIVGQIVVGEGTPDIPLLGRIAPGDSVAAALTYQQGSIDRIVILKGGIGDIPLRDIIRGLEPLSYPVHVLPDLTSLKGKRGAPGEASWLLRDEPIKPSTKLLKRGMDILMSAAAVAVLAPVLVTIAVLVRLETPGPALFRQARCGRDNRPFTVFKFRTMIANAPAADGSVQAVRGDPRVTRIGAFLRKTSLDELPQLFNVLAGTMSLVGPRPHPTELDRRFLPLIESYAARHRIAPGITGWAQVNGYRGETRTVDDMRRRIELDLEYIHNHSLAFDIWILLRTVVTVISFRNVY